MLVSFQLDPSNFPRSHASSIFTITLLFQLFLLEIDEFSRLRISLRFFDFWVIFFFLPPVCFAPSNRSTSDSNNTCLLLHFFPFHLRSLSSSFVCSSFVCSPKALFLVVCQLTLNVWSLLKRPVSTILPSSSLLFVPVLPSFSQLLPTVSLDSDGVLSRMSSVTLSPHPVLL